MILFMTKKGGALIPTSSVDLDLFDKLKADMDVQVEIRRPRNIKFHRLVWGLVNIVWKHQYFYPTTVDFMDDLKVATGHCEEVASPLTGKTRIKPKSIAFANMSEDNFRQLFEKMLDLIIHRILPKVNKSELEEEVYTALGEPRPSDMR